LSRAQLDDIHVKLEKIRAFDSMIDFSKSRIQLDIVLQLAIAHKPLSADEIAKSIGQRKKPVLDALRKLELKGIIRRTEAHRNIYELTELGRQMVNDLAAILGASNFKDVVRNRMYGKVSARDLIKVVIPVHYLYEVLIALGTAKRHELSLDTLASIVGISPQRLTVYLDPYSDSKSEIRLFKRIKRDKASLKIMHLLLGRRKSQIYYRLTDLGLELYYRLPIYMKLKNNKFIDILVKLFGYYSPKPLLIKSSLIDVAMCGLVISLALILASPMLSLIITLLCTMKLILSLFVIMSLR